MHLSIRSLLLLLIVLPFASSHAQQSSARSQRFELGLAYDADRTNLTTGNSFWLQGGSAEGAVKISHGLSAVAAITGLHSGSISSTQVPLSLVTVTAGPRYTWRAPWRPASHELSLFGVALFGTAHGLNSIFVSGSSVSGSATSLALQAGGGINLGISRRVSLQLIHADWLRTQLPNATTNVQNHLRLGAGVVIHF